MEKVKPTLYYAAASSPCRAVLLTAKALDIDLNLHEINIAKGDHLTDEYLKLNPQHTIPLLDDNGIIIYDSHVICGYLCDKYSPDTKLYPKDLVKRSQINARLYFNSGMLFCRMKILFEPILYQGSPDMPQYKIDYIEKCWDILEAFLSNPSSSPYLCGQDMTIADLCCTASVSSGRNYAPISIDKYPKLINWLNRMITELPYYDSINGRIVEQSRIHFLKTLEENRLNYLNNKF